MAATRPSSRPCDRRRRSACACASIAAITEGRASTSASIAASVSSPPPPPSGSRNDGSASKAYSASTSARARAPGSRSKECGGETCSASAAADASREAAAAQTGHGGSEPSSPTVGWRRCEAPHVSVRQCSAAAGPPLHTKSESAGRSSGTPRGRDGARAARGRAPLGGLPPPVPPGAPSCAAGHPSSNASILSAKRRSPPARVSEKVRV
mmetsp:Transcript_6941/g.22167  ORF Transcript_6941/g.22167 Transcript_6941/m.22167 type:complete len:210 (+) Transcript_6941:122-751(+)